MTNKRQRIDTEKGAKEIFDGASILLDPPLNIDLGDGVRPYWDKLVTAKATRAWKDQDLLLLVELARNLFRTEKLSREMLSEDEVVETGQGVKANPKSGVIDQLVKRARTIMIHLQIHPEATQGKAREQVNQNKAHAEASSVVEQSKDDELLASPTAH
jgi:hypothetical protein